MVLILLTACSIGQARLRSTVKRTLPGRVMMALRLDSFPLRKTGRDDKQLATSDEVFQRHSTGVRTGSVQLVKRSRGN